MRKIFLSALLIVSIYALATYFQQIDLLGKVNVLEKKESIDITKVVGNFINSHSYIIETLKNNKIVEDEKTVLPQSEEKLKIETASIDKIDTQPQENTFDESTCEKLVLEYVKKSLYASDITSYQSIGRGKIANKEYFAFHFYKNTMYLISYYMDNNFNIFYKYIFSDELRQAGTENLYRNISLNFDNSHKIDKQNIIALVNAKIGNENSKYEIIYGGHYNVNDREMVYLYYYDDENNITEIYYDCNTQQLYYMTEILEPILE